MADTSLGFRYRGRKSGGPPTIMDFVAASAATYTKGDMLSLSSGEIEIAATDDKTMLGVCLETVAATGVATTGTKVKVIVDEDAIYGVYDATARVVGTALDIAGTTGVMTIASDTNHDLMVYAPSSATEETLVVIKHAAHVFGVTAT